MSLVVLYQAVLQVSTCSSTNLTSGGAYGLFNPDLGIIILNGLGKCYSFFSHASGSNTAGGNVVSFMNHIRVEDKFQARREEAITSQHYFCRVPNSQFNLVLTYFCYWFKW